uniref:Protein kinase domain-containing protein n=1 Tax=Oryzias sinensis TaxID=183150 RepID=A0A8C7ZAB5_9TELE
TFQNSNFQNEKDLGITSHVLLFRFTIRAVVNGEGFPEGVGNNKKEAKKNAARNAWMALTGQSADSTKARRRLIDRCLIDRCLHFSLCHSFPPLSQTENVEELSSSGLRSVSYIKACMRLQENIYWEIFCILKSISVNVIRFTSEYDCIEGLGRGKFGFVYKAKRKLEGTDCAVKIVQALREVKVLSELNHCNIVRYYICWIEDSAPQWDGSTDSSSSASSSDSPVKYLYIHMELCDTKTLRAWIDEKNMQDPKKSCKRREEGLAVALQIVNGVEHIHSKTLIHRDLKPANILFDRNGMVKIGDFGLVTAEIEDDAENQKERSGFKGTPSYMAPEQKRQTVYNNKVDIFAMGLIYFELLWNFPTFHERNEVSFPAGVHSESSVYVVPNSPSHPQP